MFIRNGKRFDVYGAHVIDGETFGAGAFLSPSIRERMGVITIPDPVPPADYSDETYYRTEQDTDPYVVYTKKSPEQLQALRKEKVQAKRDILWSTGGCKLVIATEDKWFHTDAYSKQQQMALAMMGANLPEGLQWKTMDGSFVTMTPEIAQQLFAAQMARETTIFATAETKLNDETDIEEGWPEVYMEPEAVPDSDGSGV